MKKTNPRDYIDNEMILYILKSENGSERYDELKQFLITSISEDFLKKIELFDFYKESMAIVHELHLAAYTSREKRLEMIKKAYEFYIKQVKPIMQKFLDTQVKGWRSKEKVEDYKTYFG